MSDPRELADLVEASIRDAVGHGFRLDGPGPDARLKPGGNCTVQGGGHRYFVKLLPQTEEDRLSAEVDGLDALRRCDAVHVPQVIARGIGAVRAWLVMEWLDLRPISDPTTAARAAEAVAALHSIKGERFGWHRDNYVGATPQHNTPSDNWSRFFALQRLKPQFERAASMGFGSEFGSAPDRIVRRLPVIFLDHRPSPSLVHGDLWHGNLAVIADGRPTLYDPACHYGDREGDLAMSELFGGLPEAFYVAYRRTCPPSPDYERRKLLYNLYHVLNHLILFGRAYLSASVRHTQTLMRELS